MNQILRIFLLSFALFSTNSFAQERSDVAESDLVDIVKTTNNPKDEKGVSDAANSVLINQAREGLASVLLNNKIGSLMFDDQESENLGRAIDAFKSNQIYTPLDSEGNQSPEDKSKAEAEALKQLEEIKSLENEKSYIYLASIIYFGPKDWIIWINEKKITSQTNDPKKELYVRSIKRDQASITWKLSLSKWRVISGKSEDLAPKTNSDNQIEIRFELKPNQTYVLSTNKIVEGKALIALLKQKEEDKKSKTAEPKAVVAP